MIFRKIVKASLTNVDVVANPANPYSTFVMAKSDDEKPKGIVARAISAVAGLFKGSAETYEAQTENAEAGFYDLALAFRDTVANILEGAATDNEKQVEIAKATNEYGSALSNYLFSGEPELEDVVKSRIDRLRLWKNGLEASLSAGQEEELQEKEIGGAQPNGVHSEDTSANGPISSTDGASPAIKSGDGTNVGDETAKSAGEHDAATTEAGLDLAGSVGPVGDKVAVDADGAGTAKSTDPAEVVSEQPAGVEDSNAVPNGGESVSKSALSTQAVEDRLAKAAEKLKEIETLIEAKQEMVAKSELKFKCDRYKTIGFNDDGAVDVLYELSKSDPDRFSSFIHRLDLLASAAEKSNLLFEELGKSGANSKGDAVSRAETMAKSIAQEKGIDIVAARGEVWSKNPQLYADYLEEKKAGGK